MCDSPRSSSASYGPTLRGTGNRRAPTRTAELTRRPRVSPVPPCPSRRPPGAALEPVSDGPSAVACRCQQSCFSATPPQWIRVCKCADGGRSLSRRCTAARTRRRVKHASETAAGGAISRTHDKLGSGRRRGAPPASSEAGRGVARPWRLQPLALPRGMNARRDIIVARAPSCQRTPAPHVSRRRRGGRHSEMEVHAESPRAGRRRRRDMQQLAAGSTRAPTGMARTGRALGLRREHDLASRGPRAVP